MGWESHSRVVRVSAARLQRLAEAAEQTFFSFNGHQVWMEHVLGGREEVDITDSLALEAEEFPLWHRTSPHLLANVVVRGNRLMLLKEDSRDSPKGKEQAYDAHFWARFRRSSLSVSSTAATGLLATTPTLPARLVDVAHASDLLALAGAARRFHFLAHDIVRMEEQALQLRCPELVAEPTLRQRVEERVRTLSRGRVYIESACVTYTDREAFIEDLQGIVHDCGECVCGSMTHAAKRGAQVGWLLTRITARCPPSDSEVKAILAGAELDMKGTLARLSGVRFWSTDAAEAQRVKGRAGQDMQVTLTFSLEREGKDDTTAEDLGRRHSTSDVISEAFPKSHQLPGGSESGWTNFCRFYCLAPEEVSAFAASLEGGAAPGRDKQVLEQLRLVASRAAGEGQALFMQHTCS